MQPLLCQLPDPSNQGPGIAQNLYNFALVCAFFNTGSAFVAFITSPLIFSFPDIKRFWAFFFPLTRFPKSSSERDRLTALKSCSQPLPCPLKNKVFICLVVMAPILHICRVVGSCPNKNVPSALHPSGASPFPTSPLVFKSINQLSVAPDLFLSVNAKTAPPFFIASFRSAALDWRELWIRSKAAEEGYASIVSMELVRS